MGWSAQPRYRTFSPSRSRGSPRATAAANPSTSTTRRTRPAAGLRWRARRRCICTALVSTWIWSARATTAISRRFRWSLLTGAARQRAALHLKTRLSSRLRTRAESRRSLSSSPPPLGARHPMRQTLRSGSRPRQLLGGRRFLADPYVEIVAVDLRAVHRLDGELGCALGRDVDKTIAQPFSGLRIARNRGAEHDAEESKASASCSSENSGGKFATKTLPRKCCDLIGSALPVPLVLVPASRC